MWDLLRLLGPLAGVADDADRHRPDRLTFCTLGPAATIVVSCRIGNTVDIFHSSRLDRVDHFVDVLGAVEGGVDVRLDAAVADAGDVDGACTSAPGSGAGLARRCRRRGAGSRAAVGWCRRSATALVVVAPDWSSIPPSPPARGSRNARPAAWPDRRRPDASRRSRPPGCRQRVAVERHRVQRQHRRRDTDVAQLVGRGVGHRHRGRVVGRHPDHQRQLLAVLADPAAVDFRRRDCRWRRAAPASSTRRSIWYPAACSSPSAASLVIAGGAVGT